MDSLVYLWNILSFHRPRDNIEKVLPKRKFKEQVSMSRSGREEEGERGRKREREGG